MAHELCLKCPTSTYHSGIFYMPQIYDMGPTALLPLRRKACWGFFFALKNPTASVGFEPANLGTKDQHATSRPPKPHQESQLYQYNIWYMSQFVGDRPLCRSGRNFPTCVPDGHLRRVTYTRCCIDTIDSPDDEHKVARYMYRIEINIYKNCASSWLFIGRDQWNSDINTFADSYLNTQGLNNSCLKSPASTLVDLTFQSRALRSFSLNQLRNLSL